MVSIQKTSWILTEGLIGTENPCKGVAQALGIVPKIIQISLKQPWKTLCPYLCFETHNSFTPALEPPWPDLLITNGRKAIAAARYIKKKSQGQTLTVHLQNPRVKAPFLDLIAAPAHDRVTALNSIETLATPNMITKDLLENTKTSFPDLENLPLPRVAVLIGGKSKAYDMPENTTKRLIEQLQGFNASLMVTCSRRTGETNTKLINQGLQSSKNFIWDGSGKNPYHALLAYADYILVTSDSTSMISESCSTGKPVYMINLQGGSERISRFHNTLIAHGCLRKFEGSLADFSYEPLNDAKKVAEEIKKRFNLFT